MENKEAQFIDGLIVQAPKEGAPEFVKGRLTMKRHELIHWLTEQTDDWINCDILLSKKGKWYIKVNTWKPDPDKRQETKPVVDQINVDDIPF